MLFVYARGFVKRLLFKRIRLAVKYGAKFTSAIISIPAHIFRHCTRKNIKLNRLVPSWRSAGVGCRLTAPLM